MRETNGASGSDDGSDGAWLAIACRNDAEWEGLCSAAGLDHLRADPRFRTGLRRWKPPRGAARAD